VAPGDGQQRLGRGPGDLEVQEVEEVHVRAGIDHPQPAIDRERVGVELGAPALGGHDLEGIAGVHVLDDPRDHRLEALPRHVRAEGRALARGRRRDLRDRPGQQRPRLGDRRERVGVGGVDLAVVGVDVDEDRDRVLEVVEDDEHVGEHQRHVGQPDDVGVRVAQGLDRAHEVVAEEPDRAAGERRRLGERRLAESADLGGSQRVGVAGVAERPAHDLARAHADEAEAPDALPLLGGLQEEGWELGIAPAELEERADRRLEIVDEGVTQRDEVVVASELAHLVERRLDAKRAAISGDGH
jgi:hypothetical protein